MPRPATSSYERRDRMSVLQIHPSLGMTIDLYRVYNLQEQLELAGCPSQVLSLEEFERETEPAALLGGKTHVVLHRVAWDSRVAALVGAARQAGICTVFEADDLVFVPGVERWVDGVRHLSKRDNVIYREGVQRYAATYHACDAFLGSTRFLTSIRPYGPKPSGLLRNVLGRRQREVARRIAHGQIRESSRPFVVGYGAGTRTHDRDFAECAAALRVILERHPQVHLELVGFIDPGEAFAGLEDRIHYSGPRAWEDWWRHMVGWDVALAPLELRNPYCRAKSCLKYLEAGALGVPLVASAVDDYEAVVRNGFTGFLARDRSDWEAALDELIQSADRRRAIAAAAQEEVIARLTTEAQASRAAAVLNDLARGRSNVDESGFRGLDLAWLLPSPFPGSGGHANLFSVIRSLGRRGHHSVVHLDVGQLAARSEAELRAFVDKTFTETEANFRIGWNVDGAQFDAVVATSWATAEPVRGSGAATQLYFVQDLENRFFPAGEEAIRAEQSYRLGLSAVTLGRWLTHELRSRYNADSTPFDFPVEIEQGPEVVREGTPTLAFFAQPGKPRRAFGLGVAGLALFHERVPEVRIVFFGSKDVDPSLVPFPFEDRGILTAEELRKLYRECDAALVISATNPTLVSPNMMRCGCVPVDLDLDNNQFEYADGSDSLLAEPTPAGIARALERLFREPRLLERLSAGARRAVAGRSLEASVDQIEAAFVRAAIGKGVVPEEPELDVYLGEREEWVSLAEGPVTQEFVASRVGLRELALSFGTLDGKVGKVRVRLLDVARGVELVSRVFSPADLRNHDWTSLCFDPLSGRQGWKLCIEVQQEDMNRPAAALFHAARPVPGLAPARVRGRVLHGPLAFFSRCGDPPVGQQERLTYLGSESSDDDLVLGASTRNLDGVARAPSVGDQEPTPSPEAEALAAVLRERSRWLERHSAESERRLLVLENSLYALDGHVQRLAGWLSRAPWGGTLARLGLAPTTEHFIDDSHFVTAELRGGISVAQTFVSERDDLTAVGIRIATEGRTLRAPLFVQLRRGGVRGQVLHEVVIPPDKLVDNQFATARFAAIRRSSGAQFTLELRSPGSLRGAGPRVWGTLHRRSRGWRRFHMNRRVSGSLDLLLSYDEG